MDPTIEPAIVDDVFSLIKIDVGVTPQSRERQLVDFQFGRIGLADDEILFGLFGKILNLVKLVDIHIATNPFTMANNLLGIERADAWHLTQRFLVGSVEHDALGVGNLLNPFRSVAMLVERVTSHTRCVAWVTVVGKQ